MYIACGRAAARLPRLLFARSADVAVSERTPHVHETGAARLGAERPAVAADSGRAAARVAWQGPAGGLAVPDDTAAHPGSSPGRHRRGVCAAAARQPVPEQRVSEIRVEKYRGELFAQPGDRKPVPVRVQGEDQRAEKAETRGHPARGGAVQKGSEKPHRADRRGQVPGLAGGPAERVQEFRQCMNSASGKG
ncbi:hypothetical protein KL941_004372 [Ogataea angusta]|nr:hypothetical protein KL941_004372 [Ogataea angusta]